ncbi:hypothetical protein JKG47_21530 [Acidithiobacillus sp. MC6.1]|nr:hypothetical protein [Acidithiobacillus sp. MC6.1]
MPLPIAVARSLYPDRPIIAVSVCHTHMGDVAAGKGRASTLKRAMQITHRQLILEHVKNCPPDILITPTIPDIDTLDLDKAREAIHAGEVAARAGLAGMGGDFTS